MKTKGVDILFLEGYYGGSHRYFLDEWKKRSRHNIYSLTLPARQWQWRMKSAAWTFAESLNSGNIPGNIDIIFATDMLNLAEFLGLTRHRTSGIPTILYFHENQFSYPARGLENHDYSWAVVNVASALSADILVFNSKFNREDFFGNWRKGNSVMPEGIAEKRIKQKKQNSLVIPVGVDFPELDRHRPEKRGNESHVPLVLWNHRWEHDKNPEEFFRVMMKLKTQGLSFRLAVCGENFAKRPECFKQAEEIFSGEIYYFGFIKSRKEYIRILWESDIVVSTSLQEFQGISVIEAMWCGAYPLLPERLNYSYMIPGKQRQRHLYKNEEELEKKLIQLLSASPAHRNYSPGQKFLKQYGWTESRAGLDELVIKILSELDMLKRNC